MSLTILCDEETTAMLERMALESRMTVENVVQHAIWQLAQQRARSEGIYALIGIGHSGRQDLSTSVDEFLESRANRHEGWSLN